MMNSTTMEQIMKMDEERIKEARRMIEEEKSKENPDQSKIKRLEARIWRIQNS